MSKTVATVGGARRALADQVRNWIPRSGSAQRQASLVVLGDGITFLALFVTAIVLARVISKDNMATYRQVVYLGPLAVALADFGFGAAVYRFLPLYQGAQKKAFLWSALAGTTTLASAASLALVALAFPLARAFGNSHLGPALLICAAYPLATMPFALVRPVLICNGYSLKATLLETALSLTAALGVIVPLYMGSSLNQALLWWMGANLLKLPVSGWYIVGEVVGQRFSWDRSTVREVWTYVWPIQVGQFPTIVLNNFDKLLASVALPTATFASYSLGARPLPFLNAIPFSISSVAVPRMVRDLESGPGDFSCAIWRKSCLATALLTYPFAAFAVWNAKEIVSVLYTATYKEAAIPFSFFAGITFLYVVDYASLAKAMGNSRIIMRAALMAMSVSVGGSLLLARIWGIWGISASLLLSTAFVTFFYLAHYRQALRRPVRDFFPLWLLLGIGGLAFLAAALADRAQRFLWPTTQASFPVQTLKLGLSLAISLCAYAGGLLATRTLRPSIFRGIRLPGAAPGLVSEPTACWAGGDKSHDEEATAPPAEGRR